MNIRVMFEIIPKSNLFMFKALCDNFKLLGALLLEVAALTWILEPWILQKWNTSTGVFSLLLQLPLKKFIVFKI